MMKKTFIKIVIIKIIPYFFKSPNNRKFGGFTTQLWNGTGYKKDPKAFTFSLDKLKTYRVKDKDEKSIYCQSDLGPYFGKAEDGDKGTNYNKRYKRKNIYTEERIERTIYEYYGDKSPLAYEEKNYLKIHEYEVFQII